jgi:hypothetical protein
MQAQPRFQADSAVIRARLSSASVGAADAPPLPGAAAPGSALQLAAGVSPDGGNVEAGPQAQELQQEHRGHSGESGHAPAVGGRHPGGGRAAQHHEGAPAQLSPLLHGLRSPPPEAALLAGRGLGNAARR